MFKYLCSLSINQYAGSLLNIGKELRDTVCFSPCVNDRVPRSRSLFLPDASFRGDVPDCGQFILDAICEALGTLEHD
jgi:hypothetical protein